MRSTVSRRGQTVAPGRCDAVIGLTPEPALEWVDTGQEIRVVPLPSDLIRALRGIS